MEEQEEQEQQEQQERQERQEEEDAPAEEEDIRNFRPGDTVMTIRKRIREARKARLLEEQRSRSPSPMLHSRMMPFVQPEAKAMAEGQLEARETAPDAGNSSGRPMPRKVERFHKDLIRKEVWRQKFNYLFKKMQAGVDMELVHDRKNRRLSIQQQRGREEEDAEARRQRVIAGIQESVERELSKLRRASGSPRHIARLAKATQAANQPGTEVEAEMETVETETEATQEENIAICDLEPVADPKPKPKPMAWRRTGPRPKPPVAPLPVQINREVPKKSGGPDRNRRKHGIAGILQSSTSLPVLRTTPDLLGVRNEYYGGDELFMHEDILHTSNPRLFPLRGGHSTPFPIVKLSLPDFDLE